MQIPCQKISQKSRGIGLLELMLTIAILAVMLIVSVRYYGNANVAQEASALVNSFTTIKSAVENYLADNPAATTIPDMATLVSSGYLPATYGVKTKSGYTPATNVWGGTVTVTTVNHGAMFAIAQTNIPRNVCNQALGQVTATLNQSMGETAVVSASKKAGGSSSSGTGSSGGKAANYKGLVCLPSSTITVTFVS